MPRVLVLFLVATACVVMVAVHAEGRPQTAEDYPDDYSGLGVKYDEYPMIVPKKRTALLVNRLMVALKEAMQDEEREEALKNKNENNLERLSSRSNKNYSLSPDDIRSMDLQRRGHGSTGQQKGRIYWRCYFNAVTCF